LHISSAIRPRRWQKEALARWSSTLSGVAEVVTGGGKTVFAYLCLARFFDEYPHGRAVIVVPTLALLDQWFIDITAATDLTERDIELYFGGSHPEKPGKVNILVLNTARHIAARLTSDLPTMLVVDECHRAGSAENARALLGDHHATLGLSATPEREADEGFDERIAPVLGPIIYTYDYPQARADGVIVDFELVNVAIALGTEEALSLDPVRTRLAKLGERMGRASPEADKRLLSSVTRAAHAASRVPWAVKLALSHRGERIIVFHERVQSLNRIASVLQQQGQNVVTYHSGLSDAHRRDNLRLFRSGAVNLLVTCRALDEGTNVPEANVAIIAHSTSSTRQRIQRLGRVLRPAKNKEFATVYTLYLTDEEEETLKAEEHELQGVARILWRRGRLA
jgi:superfamily II DNA or RNA helicase